VGTVKEPHTTDGVDYTKTPGTRAPEGLSLVSRVVSLLPMTKQPVKDEKKKPLQLLRERTAIKTIMKQYGYGLDHMLRDGIDITDFIENRYTCDDLSVFEDISKNGSRRSLQTFVLGLGVNANHLRDFQDQLPFSEFKSLTSITPNQLCTELGMSFTEDGPLQCDGDTDWNAKDCVRLGLKMEHLISFGLDCVEQYKDLMRGLTKTECAHAEKALGVTAEHIQNLVSLDAIARENAERAEVMPPQERQHHREQYTPEQHHREQYPQEQQPQTHIPPSYLREQHDRRVRQVDNRVKNYTRHGAK